MNESTVIELAPCVPLQTTPAVHLFGIRHHGPGSARSLARALMALKPDCVLIEGPPEANDLIHHVIDAALVPPVALLIHASVDPAQSSFYPFTVFSPEWQAMTWALKHNACVRFIDLPVAHHLAMLEDASDAISQLDAAPAMADLFAVPPVNDISTLASDDEKINGDALNRQCLSEATGSQDPEAWWNRMVEERLDDDGLFEGIAEGMAFLRDDLGFGREKSVHAQRREDLREATMRQGIRVAQQEGFLRIAVVCGAWHVPALKKAVPAKHDAQLLKGLPRIKVDATWVPWSYPHMTRDSGYGAGIHSPGWYEYLWRNADTQVPRSVGWLARVARLMRENGIDCSSAHLIEAARLAQSLACLRDFSQPGLEELDEATRTVICFGNDGPMDLIRKQLIVGDNIGSVPPTVPMLPLQKDIEQTQTRLRMKPTAINKVLELDLRTDNDLARSHFLHRLVLLDLSWGRLVKSGSSRGTFKETWALRWEPALTIGVIDASRWGSTVIEAATAVVIDKAQNADDLSSLAKLIDNVLLADLENAVAPVTQLLEERATLTGDPGQMLAAIAPLSNVFRYGNVRKTDTTMLARVLDGLIVRVSVNLPMACCDLAEEAATLLRGLTLEANQAITLQESSDQTRDWQRALTTIARLETAHSLLGGMACRLLLDAGAMISKDVGELMSLNLSSASDPLQASAWLDGFMNRNAMVLLHDNAAWGLLDAWLVGLNDDHFLAIVPLIRRTFSEFTDSERRDIAAKVHQPITRRKGAVAPTSFHSDNVDFAVPMLRTLLGVVA